MYHIKSKYSDTRLNESQYQTLNEASSFLKTQTPSIQNIFEVEYDGPDNFRRMIFEGFNKNDLEGLLRPILSLDEYVAKNEDNLVIAFYIENEPLAVEPLKIFCDQAVGVVDTDMSDSDTFENTSVVYVEFLRDEQNKQNIIDLISDVAMVANMKVSDFMVRLSNIDKEYEFSDVLLDIYFKKALHDANLVIRTTKE